MRWVVSQCVMISLAMTIAQAGDVEALRGTWKLSAWHTGGKQLSDDHLKGGKLVLDGDRFTVTLAGEGTSSGTQKLDASKEPKTIDITGDSKPDEAVLGIYELDGDVFRVAFAPPGKPRPTTFTTKAEGGEWVHVWERVKE